MHERPSPRGNPWLLVVAAPAEARAVLGGVGLEGPMPEPWKAVPIADGLDLVVTGIGKANAAAGTALALRSRTYESVVNLGIAGSLPVATPLSIGDTVAGVRSAYADEGILLPDGRFVGCSEMGFPLGPFDDLGVHGSKRLLDCFRTFVTDRATIATVSTCSGTDALARAVVDRTGAVAEAMEGAAVGQVCARLGVDFLELRVISNTTGDRSGQVWAIDRALAGVARLAGEVGRASRS